MCVISNLKIAQSIYAVTYLKPTIGKSILIHMYHFLSISAFCQFLLPLYTSSGTLPCCALGALITSPLLFLIFFLILAPAGGSNPAGP